MAIDAGDEIRIGQVLSLGMEQRAAGAHDRPGTVLIRVARGEGAVLEGEGRRFHDASVRPATEAEVSAWLERSRSERPRLDVGELAVARGVPFALDAAGFGRHTFLCGQSGSGKTYSLGVLLEQLLMQTKLRIVVLDPNSDYVRLGEPMPGADGESVERYRTAAGSVAVRSGTSGDDPIRVRLRDLSPDHQAALLRLDPVSDPSEYADMLALVEDENVVSVEDLARSQAEALKLRAHNLGVDRWGIWPGPEGASLPEEVEDDAARCIVVDLGSLPTREEQAVAAGAVLERLSEGAGTTRTRRDRDRRGSQHLPGRAGSPTHGAHHRGRDPDRRRRAQVRPLPDRRDTAAPEGPRERPLPMRQPHPDADELDRGPGPRSPGLLSCPGRLRSYRAPTFAQGEALVAGRIASHPALIRFGSRISQQNGADVAGWA